MPEPATVKNEGSVSRHIPPERAVSTTAVPMLIRFPPSATELSFAVYAFPNAAWNSPVAALGALPAEVAAVPSALLLFRAFLALRVPLVLVLPAALRAVLAVVLSGRGSRVAGGAVTGGGRRGGVSAPGVGTTGVAVEEGGGAAGGQHGGDDGRDGPGTTPWPVSGSRDLLDDRGGGTSRFG